MGDYPTVDDKMAFELFEEIGYDVWGDGEHYDFYTNTKKGLTIEIRKYIDEYVKYETESKKRRGISAKEHIVITKALIELGHINNGR